MNINILRLFLVDDDVLYLKSLEVDFLGLSDFEIHTFTSGEMCIHNLNLLPDFIVLDYHLDGTDKTAMNGLETLDGIKLFNDQIPVIMLSAQDKIEVAVNCMHHRASDYVVKSETAFIRLQKIIANIANNGKLQKQINWYKERM